MAPRNKFIVAGIAAPLVAYVVTTVAYAFGGYDGVNCAGLLDSTWRCSEFEYYIDWLINPFSLVGLIGYLAVSCVVTTISWHFYKKYNKQHQ